ncbi:MAG: DinB family protein [Anaerolineae bacterium]
MNHQERSQKIESYGVAYQQLVAALKEFPTEMWQFRPTPDRWTIHEIVIHIADSEANSYVRCRRFIAEPGKDVMAYDEEGWAKTLSYHEQSTEEALELFKWLRLKSYNLIKTLSESVWANAVYHPQNGTMTMDDWLEVYQRHIPDHVAQMQAVYQEWLKQQSESSQHELA